MTSVGLQKFCLKCDKPVRAKNLCKSHYEKDLKERNPSYKESQSKLNQKWKKENPEWLKAYFKSNKENNPERLRANQRAYTARKRGLTKESFEALLIYQNNSCAVCNTPFTKTRYLDHDHQTEKARGFLCSSCNTGIGHLKESKEMLQKAIDYLNNPPAKNFLRG